MSAPTDGALLWQIIDRVRAVAGGEPTASVDAFRIELEALDDQALLEVDAEFSSAMQRAYDHDLWAAAYLIHGGGDDAFWDFRAGLIALGREVFDAALANPDLLADIEDVEDRTLFEGFQHVPGKLVEQRGLTRMGGGTRREAPVALAGTKTTSPHFRSVSRGSPRAFRGFSPQTPELRGLSVATFEVTIHIQCDQSPVPMTHAAIQPLVTA